MATNALSWRQAREEGMEFTFFSGNVANIRPIEVDFFLRVGHIPEPLMIGINQLISGSSVLMPIPKSEQIQQSQEWIAFLNELVTFAFVSPKVTMGTPQDDNEISIDDISYFEKLQLYRLFCRPAHVLREFLKKTDPVEVMENAANNGNASK